MALKDKIALGVALPHRSPEPIDMETVRRVAQRAEALDGPDIGRCSGGGPDCHRRESTGGEGYPASAGAGNEGSTRSRRAGR